MLLSAGDPTALYTLVKRLVHSVMNGTLLRMISGHLFPLQEEGESLVEGLEVSGGSENNSVDGQCKYYPLLLLTFSNEMNIYTTVSNSISKREKKRRKTHFSSFMRK